MKNNFSILYNIVGENIVLKAPEKVHVEIAPFLNKEHICKQPILFIEICYISEDEIKDMLTIYKDNLKMCRVNKLELAHFYYDENQIMYIIRPSGFGIMNFEDRTITWYIDKNDLDGRSMFHIFVLDPLSLVLPVKNKIVFHGASISVNNYSVAFLGRSGNGKSTISRLIMEENNCEKKSDDTFVIEVVPNDILLFPINSGEGYSYNLANQILSEKDSYKVLYRKEKKCYIINTHVNLSPQPLKKIIILEKQLDALKKDNYTRFAELSSPQALMHILNSQTNINSPYLSKKFELYRTISKQIKVEFACYNVFCDIKKISI